MAQFQVSTSWVDLIRQGTPLSRISTAWVDTIYGDVTSTNSIVTVAWVDVIRSLEVKTNIEPVSKLTVYMMGEVSTDNAEQTSKLTQYVALNRAPQMDVSMLTTYAVLLESPTSVSMIASYAVLETPDTVSKLTSYAVFQTPLLTSTLTQFVVLRAPYAVDKLTSYVALLNNILTVTTLTNFVVLRGREKTTKLTPYAVMNDPTPRYVYTTKLTAYNVLGLETIRDSKFTVYSAMREVPRVAIDVPKITVYAVVYKLHPEDYLSLIVATPLTGGSGNTRLSIIAPSALTGGNPNARLSYAVPDVLTGGNPTSRLAFIVAEVLVAVPREPHMIDPATHTFPGSEGAAVQLLGLGYNVKKKPNFLTGVADNQSGREVRMAYMDMPRWDFELTYEFLWDDEGEKINPETDLKTLMGFFLQRQGSFDTFLYKDPDDYQVNDNVIATADGTTTNFLLRRNFGGFNEIIGQLDQSQPLIVFANDTTGEAHTVPASAPRTIQVTHFANFHLDHGVTLVAGGSSLTKTSSSLPGPGQYFVDVSTGTYTFNAAQASAAVRIKYAYQLDETVDYNVLMPNELTFPVAPASGIEIAATFQFYFTCRFNEDAADFDKFMDKLWELQTLSFKSTLG